MLTLSPDDLRRWVVEIEEAKDFRKKEFGEYRRKGKTTLGAGQNLDYFDYGSALPDARGRAPVNLGYLLAKNIVPLLFPQRPKVLGFPTRKQDAASAPVAAALLNHFLQLLKLKATDQQVVFDTWTLGYGVSKVGYLAESGPDVEPTKQEQAKRLRERLKEQVDSVLVSVGLKKESKEKELPPASSPDDNFIRRENPYLRWVDPFDFLMDPRGRSITDCAWVGEEYRRTLYSVKRNKHYSSAKHELKPVPIENEQIPSSQMERFQTVQLHEIHYKNEDSPTGITILILAEANTSWKALYHEHSVYEYLHGWQYSLLAFNKHNHRLYPVSDLTQVRPLLHQFNETFTAILEQVQKFVSKIFVNANKLGGGETALTSPEIGAVVKVDGDPREIVMVINLSQLSQDLVVLIEKVLDLVILVTGLTRAQLTGLTTASTATEAQISQAGSSNRRLDQSDAVLDFVNEQVDGLWAVIRQFVDLETIQLLSGETSYVEEETQLPKFSFLPEITGEKAQELRHGEYRFDIEVTSLQRPNMEILRKQVENMAVVLTNEAIHQQLALQGKMFDVAEGLRIWMRLYPELIADVNRLIRPITQQVMAGMAQPGTNGHGGDRGGAAEAVRQAPPVNVADIISDVGGEKGQLTPGA